MVDNPPAPVGILLLKAAFEYVLRKLRALFPVSSAMCGTGETVCRGP